MWQLDSPIPEISNQHRRARLSSTEKLDKAFAFLRAELDWSLSDLIRTLCLQSDPKNRQRQTIYIKTAYSKDIIDLCEIHPRSSELKLRNMLLDATDWGMLEYRQEVSELGKQSGFGEHTRSVTDVDTLHGLLDTAQKFAPKLLALFDNVTSQSRSRDRQRSDIKFLSSRFIVILAILCNSQSQRHNNVQTLLGLYLHSNGVHRRVLELLARCGISVSYVTILRLIKDLSDKATMTVAAAANSPYAVTVYDNFEQMEGVREQRVEGNSTFHSITAAEVFHGLEIPDGGLTQDMLNTNVRLEPEMVLLSPGNSNDDVQQQIAHFFIFGALNEVFSESIEAVFDKSIVKPPAMPKIDVLPAQITKHWPLGPIFHDESTNVGNFAVLDNIFSKQYGLGEDSELYSSRLFLVYGDQKTVQRIRSCKHIRRRANQHYDSLRWMLPVAGLFHLKMNYLYMISNCHYGGLGADPSTLYDAANFWRRKKISKAKSDFFALEELVIHSFQARVIAIYWSLVSNTEPGKSQDDIDRITRIQSSDTILSQIEHIRETYFQRTATRNDQELENHCLFLQHTLNYLLLKYSIKYADLGLLRRAVDRACILFAGTNQHKYAHEMLQFQKVLNTSATPTLQRAILANSLVNVSGHNDSWFETDRMMEFHIGNMKDIFKARRGSSIDVEYLFQYCSLNSSYFRLLRIQIERAFSIHVNPEHTVKSAKYDLSIMAERLVRQGSIEDKGPTSRPSRSAAPDLARLGLIRLAGESIEKFNFKELRGHRLDDEEESEDLPEDFFESHEGGDD